MATRKYGTCFFEQYAQISLAALLGPEYDRLVNRDRPDLQSEGDRSIGIEVTRAMPEQGGTRGTAEGSGGHLRHARGR